MSGFSNEMRGGSGKYANFKDGSIITMLNGEKKSFSHLSGFLIDIDLQDDEYEGKSYRKIVLFIDQGEGITQLGFPFSSGYGHAFCCILPNVDPGKEIKISGQVTKMKDSDKKYSSVFIEQDGKHLKWYFKNGTKEGDMVPKVETVTVGKGKSAKEIKDYSAREEFFEKVILKKFLAIKKVWGEDAVSKKEKELKAKKQADNASSESLDGMPF